MYMKAAHRPSLELQWNFTKKDLDRAGTGAFNYCQTGDILLCGASEESRGKIILDFLF